MPDPTLKLMHLTPAARRELSDQMGLVEYLAFCADQANYRCADLLRQGFARKAMAVAGEAMAYEQMITVVAPPDAPKQESDEPFVDPAYRFHPELAPREEELDAGTE